LKIAVDIGFSQVKTIYLTARHLRIAPPAFMLKMRSNKRRIFPMMSWRAPLAAVLLSFTSAYADQVDDIVAAEMKRQHIPGLSIAVVKNGKIVKEKGYGLANVEHQVSVTPDTIFQSGSVGKQFTAALTMLLVEDGKIKLDAPVSTYLPNLPDTWVKITVRHLLNHTAGLAFLDKTIDLRKDHTEDALLQTIIKVPVRSAPGEKWAYSNLGYQVLGILCSKVGGKFYGDQLRERIFLPSGMGTRIISERDIVPNRAAGYDRENGTLLNQTWVAPSQNTPGDGSLYLTARDLARWSVALDGDKLLNKSAKEAMWSPAKLNHGGHAEYGFGWELNEFHGHRLVQHGGAWQGFTSYITRFIDDKVTVAVLANRSRAQLVPFIDKIADQYIPGLIPPAKASVQPTAASFASTPMFLRGSMNEWGLRDRMRKVTANIYEAEITLDAGEHEFKVGAENWDTIDFGARFDEEPTDLEKAKSVEFKGGNLRIEVAAQTKYVFRFDVSKPQNPSLTVRKLARP
jgi:CubicO group peptidase (beta-lactamase class C family)